MPKEIERKFLVLDQSYKQLAEGVLYRQGYLSFHPSVRIRIIGQKALLTIKGTTTGISRSEFEYEIPLQDGLNILQELCKGSVIEKYRYKVEYKGFTWEIDEFLKENEGLVVAEIELKSEDQAFDKPPFIGEEVSYDRRYRNSSLISKPYSTW
ncbi:MAG: CYTH domain-containing protein [Ruminiclostridium sp.]|nr:CYTH domain-containing protein [Ruminiclostridium sp.]